MDPLGSGRTNSVAQLIVLGNDAAFVKEIGPGVAAVVSFVTTEVSEWRVRQKGDFKASFPHSDG